MTRFSLALLSLLTTILSPPAVASDRTGGAHELVGLWEATRRFGPDVGGTLTLERTPAGWTAEVGPHRLAASVDGCWISFEVPGDRGSFRGCLETGGPIVGHWTQPRTRHGGLRAATPVVLELVEARRWHGEVAPFDDRFTFYLVVEERDDGVAGAFLRNPERNFGVFLNVDRLERDGEVVNLVGRWRRNEEERVLASGPYVPDLDVMTFRIRGASYDFRRVEDDAASGFYARGSDPEPWAYRPPPQLDDGWAVGTLAEAGISAVPLRKLIEREIDPLASSVHAPYVHAMLIARRGKLVLEEYFHGFHRALPHDTRSASKSAAAVLAGAAIEAGEPVALSMPVYETIYGADTPDGLDPRAARLTLEHLLTMSSGLDCDDRDPESPGNEDRLQSQSDNPDWYDYTLSLDMVREPGEEAVYCSAGSNLVGSVLAVATGESLEWLFHRLLAMPLDVGRYHLYLQPTGEPYMGGGIFWLPRDFMKIGQLILDGGTWRGRRVLGEAFAERATAPLYELRERRYGYLWWVEDYPYRDGMVRAFYAGGNGGQVVIGVPELDLLVAFFAGNYSDPVLYRIQNEFLPEYVLPAVDRGD